MCIAGKTGYTQSDDLSRQFPKGYFMSPTPRNGVVSKSEVKQSADLQILNINQVLT